MILINLKGQRRLVKAIIFAVVLEFDVTTELWLILLEYFTVIISIYSLDRRNPSL